MARPLRALRYSSVKKAKAPHPMEQGSVADRSHRTSLTEAMTKEDGLNAPKAMYQERKDGGYFIRIMMIISRV